MKKIIFYVLCLFIGLSAKPVFAANEAQNPYWSANNPDVAIYDDPQGIGVYEVEYDNIGGEQTGLNDTVRLLMINGGFVPNPSILVENERTLVPVRTISECLGAKVYYDDKTRDIKITDTDIEIQLKINSDKANVNGKQQTLDCSAMLVDSKTYVPLRFIVEALGATVQYIPMLNYETSINTAQYGTRYLARENVSVVVVEKTTDKEKIYSVDEGLTKIKKASSDAYSQLLEYLKVINEDFSEIKEDYDSQAVYYANFDIGRYYVYKLEKFERYPILFNKYTGEIFCEKAGLPFTNISNGFINISWLYQ